jgi:hypothetical protein
MLLLCQGSPYELIVLYIDTTKQVLFKPIDTAGMMKKNSGKKSKLKPSK